MSNETEAKPKKTHIKIVYAEYIESGTYVGGEEEASCAGIKSGEVCIVTKKRHAKLVKAAPDLLAACKRLVEVYAGQITNTGEDYFELLDDARKAIKKAEGKA